MDKKEKRALPKAVLYAVIPAAALIIILLIFLIIHFCPQDKKALVSCTLYAADNAELKEDLSGEIDGSINFVLPADFKSGQILLEINHTGQSLLLENKEFLSRQTAVTKGKQKIKILLEDGTTEFYDLYITVKDNDAYVLQSLIFEESNNKGLKFDIVCSVAGGRISGYIPASADIHNLIPTYVLPDGKLYADGKALQSGESGVDFAGCKELISKSGDKEKKYYLNLQSLTDDKLPSVYIYNDACDDTDIPNNRYIDKKNPKEAKFSIYNAPNSAIETKEYLGEKISIKLRGNSSLDFPKKNYTLRFENKVSLLGMTKSRKYVLQANYCDKSLMRNALAFTLSKKLEGLEFTSDYRYVNLFINGKYYGNYMLIERIDVGKDRLDITEQTGSGDISGGYLLELCQRKNKDYIIKPAGYPVSIRYPVIGELTVAQVEYITDYFTEMIEQINSGKNFDKYIDEDSFVDWFLVNELMKANDAKGYASVYLYKDAGDVMHMGPVWDYDISSGNCDYGEPAPEGDWIAKHMWFPELLKNKEFFDKTCARWKEIRGDMYEALDDIEKIKGEIYKSQADNFERWEILGKYIWPNGRVCNTYDEEVDYLKEWITERLSWMDAEYLK